MLVVSLKFDKKRQRQQQQANDDKNIHIGYKIGKQQQRDADALGDYCLLFSTIAEESQANRTKQHSPHEQ
ncbi:MAG: hypothetical protein R8J84_01625 [Mariprofundales bacterium]